MLAVVAFSATILPSLALHGIRRDLTVPLDVGSITARGTPKVFATSPTAEPGTYTLSQSAASFGFTASNARLSGGGAEIPLFEAGKVPVELPGDAGTEVLLPNDPSDLCAKGDRAGYSIFNVTAPTMVPFIVPTDASGRRDAAVIVAPGGSRRFLSWSKEGTQIAKWLNSIGISAFVLKYRVPANTYETQGKQLVDAQRAVSLVRHRAHEFSLNASRIGFMGFSAGAMLAVAVSTAASRKYPPMDQADTLRFQPDFALAIYGFRWITQASHAPPTFIAIARNDPCAPVAGALLYYSELLAASPSELHELHIYSDGHHGYGDCTLYVDGGLQQPVCSWTVSAQFFMERLLGIEHHPRSQAMTIPAPA